MSAAQALAQGLISPTGKLAQLLPAIEGQVAAGAPTSAIDALGVIGRAAASVGLELDAALAVARAAVLAENPDVAILGDPQHGPDPSATTLLAARLAARSDAMHELIAAYLAALDALARDPLDTPF